MTTSLRDPVTHHRWKIDDFQKQWLDAHEKKQSLYGNNFGLESRPNIHFALRFDTNGNTWSSCWYGIQLKNFDGRQFVDIRLKIWFENQSGEKFGEESLEKNFSNQDALHGWGFASISHSVAASLNPAYINHEAFHICCEVELLNKAITSIYEFFLNQLTLFEREIHDTILKVGNTEFKVLKSYFIAQSEEFEKMFSSSYNGQIPTFEIKNIDAKTMMSLIKWLYTGQLDGSIEGLLLISRHYKIKLLEKDCIRYFVVTLSNENVGSRLKFASTQNIPQLSTAATNHISNKMSVDEITKMMASQNWSNFARENPTIADKVNASLNSKIKETMANETSA